MSAGIHFFDRSGRETDEIVANPRCSWILDDEGDASFALPARDVRTKEDVLQFGNLILIEHDDDLLDWAGVLDLDPGDRNWSGDLLNVSAYSMERLLKYGETPIQKITGTAGSIFRQLIDLYNLDTDMPILPGEIWMGGPQREETLGDSCFVHIKRVTERAKCNWNITHQFVNGKLQLYANLYEVKGQRTGRLLFDGEGGNLEKLDPKLMEVGPIYNIVTGYSDSSTGGSRLKVTLRNETSIRLFGKRRTSQTFSGITDATTLERSTQSYLDGYAMPRRQTAIHVLNKDGIYATLDLGNIHSLSMQDAGYSNGELGTEGETYLISMEYEGLPDRVKCGVRFL